MGKKGKMADVILEILDDFSLVWVLMYGGYLHSKSMFFLSDLEFGFGANKYQ